MISRMLEVSSLFRLMYSRGITGKLKHMWNSGSASVPKYSTTSSGHWFASASSSRPGYSRSTIARKPLRISCVSGRFSQLVPSRSMR